VSVKNKKIFDLRNIEVYNNPEIGGLIRFIFSRPDEFIIAHTSAQIMQHGIKWFVLALARFASDICPQ